MKTTLARLILLLGILPLARGDAVLDWNAITVQTVVAGARPGPSGIIDFAVVQAAVHDAVQAYDGSFEAYATVIEDAEGSPAAAVAQAAHDVLVNRFPAQTAALDLALANYLTANSIAADDPGLDVGAEAAAGIIANRADDGGFPAVFPPNFGSEEIGMWRPTPSLLPPPPPSLAPFGAPWIGDVTPFVILDNHQFAAKPPYGVKSGKYTREYKEVKELGSLNSTVRTPEQTQLAYFWADNFPVQVNRIVRSLAESELDNSADRARLFALVWLAAADGLITTWHAKISYPTWRPITAIREGEYDGNKHTKGDPDWQPLINTPNYPDHSSGANSVVSGLMKMLGLFFGTDKFNFTVTSLNPNVVDGSRDYTRFSDAALEVVEARILQGVHFRASDRDGRKVGLKVARWVYTNALRPLDSVVCAHRDPDEDQD
jgi:hypothetical protein